MEASLSPLTRGTPRFPRQGVSNLPLKTPCGPRGTNAERATEGLAFADIAVGRDVCATGGRGGPYLTKPRLRASFPISLAIPNTTSRADSGFFVSLKVVHKSLSSLMEKIVVSTWTTLSVYT